MCFGPFPIDTHDLTVLTFQIQRLLERNDRTNTDAWGGHVQALTGRCIQQKITSHACPDRCCLGRLQGLCVNLPSASADLMSATGASSCHRVLLRLMVQDKSSSAANLQTVGVMIWYDCGLRWLALR
jgi:hypothetical protein